MLRITPARALQVLEPLLDDIALAALQADEDAALLCGIALRESIAGTILTPPGHMGRGDGGHGRGIWQIDDRGPFRHLIPPDGVGCDWPVFDQALAACVVLSAARRELVEFCALPVYERAVCSRYNAALVNVRRMLREGKDPDLVTTGRDYGADVLRLRDVVRAARPERFPLPHPRSAA